MKWLIPEDDSRAHRLEPMFAAMARHHYIGGGGCQITTVGGAINAATLWAAPNRWKESRIQGLLMARAYIRAFGSRMTVARDVFELVEHHHPSQPHWHLQAIGSDPNVRGRGFGNALMRSGLDRCDAQNVPAYLESTNPVNVPYYERFGFEVIDELVVPDDAPTLWGMWRPPSR